MIEKELQTSDLAAFSSDIVEMLAASSIATATILALSGDLGAGKTTFTQALAKTLGVAEVVTSPTFVVMRIYDTAHSRFTRLVHIDAYRFENADEIAPLHLETYISDQNTLICIEWPERLQSILPSHYHQLNFSVIDESTRKITYDKK